MSKPSQTATPKTACRYSEQNSGHQKGRNGNKKVKWVRGINYMVMDKN